MKKRTEGANVEYQTFAEWLTEQGEIDPAQIELLRKCWNAAVSEASSLFGEYEGVDHGVYEMLEAKE